MPTYSRVLLSGSTSGRPIPVAATATPGTVVHTAIAGATSFDEIYLVASNITGAAVTLTLEWGGVTTGDQITQALSIPANSSPVLIVPGLPLNGGLLLRAFASAANSINLTGYVNRIA